MRMHMRVRLDTSVDARIRVRLRLDTSERVHLCVRNAPNSYYLNTLTTGQSLTNYR